PSAKDAVFFPAPAAWSTSSWAAGSGKGSTRCSPAYPTASGLAWTAQTPELEDSGPTLLASLWNRTRRAVGFTLPRTQPAGRSCRINQMLLYCQRSLLTAMQGET